MSDVVYVITELGPTSDEGLVVDCVHRGPVFFYYSDPALEPEQGFARVHLDHWIVSS